jgi:hypothetical protein
MADADSRRSQNATAAGASPEKQALLNAYEDVLKSEAERRAEGHARPKRRAPIGLIGLCILGILGGTALITQPAWLFTPPPPPESPAVRDASLRIALYITAQRLAQYRSAHGHLPATLKELNTSVPAGVAYRRGDSTFVLQATADDVSLTLRSTDSLPLFLGRSFRVLAERGKR